MCFPVQYLKSSSCIHTSCIRGRPLFPQCACVLQTAHAAAVQRAATAVDCLLVTNHCVMLTQHAAAHTPLHHTLTGSRRKKPQNPIPSVVAYPAVTAAPHHSPALPLGWYTRHTPPNPASIAPEPLSPCPTVSLQRNTTIRKATHQRPPN